MDKYDYLCEVCGKTESLTQTEAYDSGWDYPPFIGVWGVISPRTCPNCTIEKTAYWWLMTRGTKGLPANHLATVERIIAEQDPAMIDAKT